MKKILMISALFLGSICATYAADDETGIKLRGDADGNKEVGMNDINIILKYLATGSTEGLNMYGADADGNNDIGMNDINTILKILTSGSAN